MKKQIIGIDLGTTFSAVSVIEGGSPVIIVNSEGKRTTPSVVSFTNEETKVGDGAKRQLITNAKNTVYSVKRFMGKQFKDVKNEVNVVTYKVENKSGLPVVNIDGKFYTPQEISARILQKLKKDAEDYLGTTVDSAVITVPAYFNDSERTSVKQAGEIAGLKVERIINEPTAAALAYGIDKKDDAKIVVFDLGGSTFDVSILDLGDGIFEVLSTDGNLFLGGDNFDEKVVEWLVDEFKSEYGIDLRKDPMAYQRLREAAEKAKIELSSATETEINLPYIIPVDGIPKHLVKKLTRSKFEQLIDSLLDKITGPCVQAIKESRLNLNEIDEVILVGGSTRTPSVQIIVKKIFGKEPSKVVNPDEAVSLGAAIQGGVLSGDVTDVLLLDVTPLNLGIETMGNVMTKLIEANTTIPTKKSETFSTASDNQPGVEIHILQGNRPMSNDNKSLGRFHLDGIPPSPRGVPQIEVTFDIDANGILNVTASDKATNKNQFIRIEGSSTLDEKEIERMKAEAEANAENDKQKKEEIDTFNKADGLIFQTEKQIKDYGDKLNEDDKTKLNSAVEQLKEKHKNKDYNGVKSQMDELTEVWNKISTKLYQETQNNQNTQNTQNTETPPNNQNTEDVEFEDVKN